MKSERGPDDLDAEVARSERALRAYVEAQKSADYEKRLTVRCPRCRKRSQRVADSGDHDETQFEGESGHRFAQP